VVVREARLALGRVSVLHAELRLRNSLFDSPGNEYVAGAPFIDDYVAQVTTTACTSACTC
jgi:hypothetical protein